MNLLYQLNYFIFSAFLTLLMLEIGVALLALSAASAVALYRNFVAGFEEEPDVTAKADAVKQL